jgi:hypothetical protein
MRYAPLSLIFPLLPVAACSSSSSGAGPGSGAGDGGPGVGVDGDTIGCDSGGFAFDTYKPNLTKAGKSGIYTFVLTAADPAPPAEGIGAAGINTWTVKVVDASGAPVKGATISLPVATSLWSPSFNPFMPRHGHGTSIVPKVTSNGDGTATLVMDLSMGGVWQVFVEADSGSTVDGAMFAFCMP